MKRSLFTALFFLALFATKSWAQSGAPEKISFQAVVRNASNALVTNQAVGMRVSILQGSASGSAVYSETQTPTSNANGLVTIEIGGGNVVSGSIGTINWVNGPYFIRTEVDPTGGTNYTITGTSQLLSVPYALYAKTSGSSTPGPAGPIGPQGVQGPQGVAGANGQGVPTGGTANQVLAKVDGTDYNTAWVTPSGGGWSLTGNAGTNSSTNFIGTTDNVALTFRTNNTARWSITPNGRLTNTSALGSSSLFIGGGNETSTGAQNTVVGVQSLINNSTGTDNVTIGFNTMNGNSTGSGNTIIGTGANASFGNLNNATAIGANANVNASNKIRLGDNNVTSTEIAGQLRVNGQAIGTNDFTLPANRGTANQVLQTDGAGATQWVTPSAGTPNPLSLPNAMIGRNTIQNQAILFASPFIRETTNNSPAAVSSFIVPANTTITIRFYSYENEGVIYELFNVTPVSTGVSFTTAGGALATCTTSSWSSGAPTTCTITYSATAGQLLTIGFRPSAGGNFLSTGATYTQFSAN